MIREVRTPTRLLLCYKSGVSEPVDPLPSDHEHVDLSPPRRSRRRLLVLGSIAVVSVLVVGGLSWWGVARSEAYAESDGLVGSVAAVEHDARQAHEDAKRATSELVAVNEAIVDRVLALAGERPELLSPEIVVTLQELADTVSPLSSGNGVAVTDGDLDAIFADDADELTDEILWGDADGIRKVAAAEIARLTELRRELVEQAATSSDVRDQLHVALALLVVDTAARAGAAHARFEHAGDLRPALEEHAAVLRGVAEGAQPDDWLPVIEQLEAYAASVDAAQAAHDQRVAEIEAEAQRVAEEARRGAERQAPQRPGGGTSEPPRTCWSYHPIYGSVLGPC